MENLIIIGLVLLGISLPIVVLAQISMLAIDVSYYCKVLETKTIFFPVSIPDDDLKKMLEKPLCLSDVCCLVKCRLMTFWEERLWNIIRPLQIIGMLLVVGGNVYNFDSGFMLILALLSAFLVPKIVFLLAIFGVLLIELLFLRLMGKKYKKVSG